jgi:TDG/mug DNA glycosylase family protein
MNPSLPDLLEPGLKAVFCGINPGARAAEAGHHFLGHSNRFWRVLHLAGFTPGLIRAQDDATLLDHGFGITAVVGRPTAKASQVTRSEFVLAAAALKEKIERFAPSHFAFLGKVAFASIFNQREVAWGRQQVSIGNTTLWVLPNPSGLNRGFILQDLVTAYAAFHTAICSPARQGAAPSKPSRLKRSDPCQPQP